jgi:hypothetical protein
MGYKITRSGSVYLPNKKGTLSRIKGEEATLVLHKYIAAVRTAEEKAKDIKGRTRATCHVCGGTLIGDGYTTTRHCENADFDQTNFEPDANPVYCKENP